MPDKRLKGATEYSTHLPTQRVRARIANMTQEKRDEYMARQREYSAIWSCCIRVSRRKEYRRATIGLRRSMLINQANAVMGKRRADGKTMCGTSILAIVDKHLKRESNIRNMQKGKTSEPISLKGIPVDISTDQAMLGDDETDDSEQDKRFPLLVAAHPQAQGPDDSPLPLKFNSAPQALVMPQNVPPQHGAPQPEVPQHVAPQHDAPPQPRGNTETCAMLEGIQGDLNALLQSNHALHARVANLDRALQSHIGSLGRDVRNTATSIGYLAWQSAFPSHPRQPGYGPTPLDAASTNHEAIWGAHREPNYDDPAATGTPPAEMQADGPRPQTGPGAEQRNMLSCPSVNREASAQYPGATPPPEPQSQRAVVVPDWNASSWPDHAILFGGC